MPNQRAKGKVYLGGFVDQKLKARLVRMARSAGKRHNVFGLATELIEESLRRRENRQRRA